MAMHEFFVMIGSWRNEFICFAICISLPAILLYTVEILTILWHREFHNPFFTLVIVRSIPNIIYTLNSYLFYRFPVLFGKFLYPTFQLLPSWVFQLCFFLSNHSMLADYLATILILANRWTAIAFPVRHKQFWPKFLPYGTLIVFGVPFLLYVEEFRLGASVQIEMSDKAENNETFTSFYLQSDPDPLLDSFPTSTILCVLFMAICLLINGLTLKAYYKFKKQGSNNGRSVAQQNRERVEAKLLAYAIITFLAHIIMAVILTLIFIAGNMDDPAALAAIYTQYPWCMDLNAVVIPSLLLFWASDSLRRKIRADFWPSRFVGGLATQVTPTVPDVSRNYTIRSGASSTKRRHN